MADLIGERCRGAWLPVLPELIGGRVCRGRGCRAAGADRGALPGGMAAVLPVLIGERCRMTGVFTYMTSAGRSRSGERCRGAWLPGLPELIGGAAGA